MNVPTRSFSGIVYRAHHPRWASDPLSGAGAARFGGRFNPKGVPTLYTALAPETAWLEAQQGFAFKAQPLTLVAYSVECQAIVDLTDGDTRETLGVDLRDLGCSWDRLAAEGKPVPSWNIYTQLKVTHAAGIKVPSYAPGARGSDNLVFWQWGTKKPCRVTVIDDENRLPRDQSSWSGNVEG